MIRMIRKLVYALLLIALTAPAAAVTIENPLLDAVVESPVLVNVSHNETADELSYTVGAINDSCNNCSALTDTINLSAGEYTLVAAAKTGNETETANASFTVQEPFSLSVHAPENTTYNETVPVNVSTNRAATITYALDNETPVTACTNCTAHAETLNTSPGNHTVFVQALADNETRNRTVAFSVRATGGNETSNETGNQTRNETEPSEEYGPVFNKLPQAVARGEVSDEELAAIIRNNSLVPGVINRLVTTGDLGNESIDAIIETQRTPPGILQKVFGFFGVHVPTAKERLAAHYTLSAKQKRELAEDPDVSKQVSEQLRKEADRTPKRRGPPSQAPSAQPAGEDRESTGKPESPGRSDEAPGKASAAKDRDRAEKERSEAPSARGAVEKQSPAEERKSQKRTEKKAERPEKALNAGGQDRRRGPPAHAASGTKRNGKR